LKSVIDNPLTPPANKVTPEAELVMHIDAAIAQRRAIKHFTLRYINSLNLPVQPVNMPDYVDGEDDGETAEENKRREINEISLTSKLASVLANATGTLEDINNVLEITQGSDNVPNSSEYCALVPAEDYGQGIAMPHFGYLCPQSDYFNSNLTVNLYVQSDISRGENNCILYDERCMGKDKDALCTLRLKSHIENVVRCQTEKCDLPEVYISIRDNCVGQNKSNVTMMFDCWMAMSLYKRVMIIFLIPGHSHMIADRVVAWAKASLRNKDIFVPEGLTK
jgi:hypothetical protein